MTVSRDSEAAMRTSSRLDPSYDAARWKCTMVETHWHGAVAVFTVIVEGLFPANGGPSARGFIRGITVAHTRSLPKSASIQLRQR